MRVYQDANDKYITSKIFFGKAEDGKLYTDAEFTAQATEDAVVDAYLKGVLMVKVDDAFFRPVKVEGYKVVVVDVSSGAAAVTEFVALAKD